jgi:hypothetical protein
MKDSNDLDIPRRRLFKSAAAAGLRLAAGAFPSTSSGQASSGRDLIRKENAKPGTTSHKRVNLLDI